MSEQEQRRLYEHFKKLSVNGNTSIQRENSKKYGDEILKSHPQFEIEKTPEKETKSKGKK